MSKIYDALIKLEAKQRSAAKSFSFVAPLRNSRATRLTAPWRNLSGDGRLIVSIATVLLLFGMVLVAVTSQLVSRTLRNQIERRTLMIATSFADAAAGHVAAKNVLELYALVTKIARLDGSAYAFIENHKGEILVHTHPDFRAETTTTNLTLPDRRNYATRVLRLHGRIVYETRAPILEGRLGTARIAVWGDSVTKEVDDLVLPVVTLGTSLVLFGVALATVFARGLVACVSRLTEPETA